VNHTITADKREQNEDRERKEALNCSCYGIWACIGLFRGGV